MKALPLLALTLSLVTLTPARADDTPLAEQMDIINDAYKMIRRDREPENHAKMARDAQNAVLEAIKMTPAMVEAGDHPDGAEKAMAEYRRQMGALFVIWCEMEQAILAEDKEKLDAAIEALKESKKAGHDAFMDDE